MIRSQHFRDMLEERNIAKEWVDITERSPDIVEEHEDGTRHYIKQISECENRWLRVVVNTEIDPNKEVTVFFDRRLRKKYEN